MSRPLMQRLALPTAIVVAIATAAGCSGGNNNNTNPAQGTSTAPMPAAPAPTTSAQSPVYNPAAPATTASTAAPGATSTSAMAAGASGFADQAARAGMMEVKSADLALQKSRNSQVKSFAREMKRDHTNADQKLKQAVGTGTQLPTDLAADQQQQLDSLQSKSGAAFDKAYADQEVQDHQKAVSLFEDASHNAPTAQLRDYASQTLPTLKEHLKRAQQLQSKVGG